MGRLGMDGLIIGSGTITNYKNLERLVNKNNFIVCADGGVNHILKINRLPDIVLGDLDSIGTKELDVLKKNKIKIERFPVMKNKTDMELCVDFLLGKSCKNIGIVGATGTRLDHTISNLLLLQKIYKEGVKASIFDDNNKVSYTEDSIGLNKADNTYVSIVPLDNSGAVVSLEGLLYPLKHEKIDFASTFGVSNELVGEKGEIIVHEGSVLVIESKD